MLITLPCFALAIAWHNEIYSRRGVPPGTFVGDSAWGVSLSATLEAAPHSATQLDAHGGTPLRCAAKNGQLATATALLAAGAGTNVQDRSGWWSSICAAESDMAP